jgi:hypothetical protein
LPEEIVERGVVTLQDLASLTLEDKSIAHIMRRVSLLPGMATSSELDEAVKESREFILKIRGKVGYLPPTYADKLLFLAHAPNNPTWVPFEEGQAKIFAASRRADRNTSFWLHPMVALPLMLLFSSAAYIAMATFAPEQFSARDALGIMSFVGMMSSLFSQIFGWWVTGVSNHVWYGSVDCNEHLESRLRTIIETGSGRSGGGGAEVI